MNHFLILEINTSSWTSFDLWADLSNHIEFLIDEGVAEQQIFIFERVDHSTLKRVPFIVERSLTVLRED